MHDTIDIQFIIIPERILFFKDYQEIVLGC